MDRKCGCSNPSVTFLRRFANDHRAHGLALADASARWGRLWRQGIPYTTLLTNAINHPDRSGMRLFADELLGDEPDSIHLDAGHLTSNAHPPHALS